jgi:hypothetical protein
MAQDAGLVDSCLQPPESGGTSPPDSLVYCPYPLLIEWDDEDFKVLEVLHESTHEAEKALDDSHNKLTQIEQLLKKHRNLKRLPQVNDARKPLPPSSPLQ